MMTQRQQTDIRILQALFTDVRFESIFNAIDRLHDAASSGKLAEVTNLSQEDVIGWLHDIIYTAEETILELEAHDLETGEAPQHGSDTSNGQNNVWDALLRINVDLSVQN